MIASRFLAPLFMALILAGCGLSAPTRDREAEEPEVLLPEHLAELDRILLDLHNRERAEVGAPPLVWDTGLAAAAAGYGPALAARGSLTHSPQASRPGQGENLWMGTHARYSLASMFGGWAGEKRSFRPGRFPDVSRTGKWSDVAHYTQIIWRSTRRVGCAVRQTPAWDYLICRYAPPGNFVGQTVP